MKQSIKTAVHLNAYTLIERAVGEGVSYGWHRAHKHTDKPGETVIKENLEREVMNALCEILIFPESR